MQIWTNIWKKRDASPYDSEPYYTASKTSYHDAMDDIYESGEQFSLPASKYNLETKKYESFKQKYDYLCTQYSQFDKNGKLEEHNTHTDLADELESWNREREEGDASYRSAATLSASQLCDVGRRS